jgi:hypothetical protein
MPGGSGEASDTANRSRGSMIRRYIIWRNKHTADTRLRALVTRVNLA